MPCYIPFPPWYYTSRSLLFQARDLTSYPIRSHPHNFFYVAQRPQYPCEVMKDERARLGTPTLSHYHTLHPSHVTFFGCDFEVAVDDTSSALAHGSGFRKGESAYVTASKIPVPDPSAPIKSLATDRAPMQAPPNAAAVGIMRLSSLYMLCSL
jgi:hypothetical protein